MKKPTEKGCNILFSEVSIGYMEKNLQPDAITKAACKWLLSGAEAGEYAGPAPGTTHGLTPLLAFETGRNKIGLSCAAMWMRQEQITESILEKIAEEGIFVWAVKGFDLARSVYPFPGGRPMSDSDLFIQAKDRQSIMRIFHQAGWSKGSPGDGVFTSAVVSEMKMFKQDVIIELHTHIFYFPAVFPGRLPVDLFENGRSLASGLMGFAWHNALLLVIIHFLTNELIRPVWWVDVCLLCRKVTEADTWDIFLKNAFNTKLGGAIATVLITASLELYAPVPGAITSALLNCENGREFILEQLKSARKVPTLLNLKYLPGWKKISWFYALFWLSLSRQQPLRR